MKFYTYIYRNGNVPIYVGKGTDGRFKKHLKKAKNKHLAGHIENMRAKSIEPTIQIIEALNEDHAKFLEICLIEIFGRVDLKTGTLFNHTGGGDGRTAWSDEEREAHSLKITGQKRSDETRSKMRMAAQGKDRSINFKGKNGREKGCIIDTEHKKKLATAQTGKKHSEETKEKIAASWVKRRLQKSSKNVAKR